MEQNLKSSIKARLWLILLQILPLLIQLGLEILSFYAGDKTTQADVGDQESIFAEDPPLPWKGPLK